mgnify:CR=1 FL=1
MYKKIFVFQFILFISGCSSGLNSSESWIDYNDISRVKIGMSRDGVATTLGEPILVLANTEYDNTVYVFYNYHIKRYKLDGDNINSDSRVNSGERATLLKFTFVDESLSSWEEEKITLSMTAPKSAGRGSLMNYFSFEIKMNYAIYYV